MLPEVEPLVEAPLCEVDPLGYVLLLPLVLLGEVADVPDCEPLALGEEVEAPACEPLVLVSLCVELPTEPVALPAPVPLTLPLVEPLTPPVEGVLLLELPEGELLVEDVLLEGELLVEELLPEGEVLVLPAVEPDCPLAEVEPDCALVEPAPCENVSFEVDCGSLVVLLVPVLVELWSALPAVAFCGMKWLCGVVVLVPLVLEFDVSLFPLVVLPWVLPEMLPEVLGELVLVSLVALAVPPVVDDAEPLALTFRLSFTDWTPETDFAISFARFLSSLLATFPSSVALPLLTETCTPLSAWSWLNCC